MGSVDRGIHRDHPVHLALGIGLGGQFGKDPVPGAVIGELLVPLPHRLPRPEHLPGKIPPRDPGAVAVGDRLHHGAVITVGTPHLALVARQQRLDSLPLPISENPGTTHPATLPRPSAHGCETRPSRLSDGLAPGRPPDGGEIPAVTGTRGAVARPPRHLGHGQEPAGTALPGRLGTWTFASSSNLSRAPPTPTSSPWPSARSSS